jgi:RNA polymerase sigma-70 factor (ECF subfamily)
MSAIIVRYFGAISPAFFRRNNSTHVVANGATRSGDSTSMGSRDSGTERTPPVAFSPITVPQPVTSLVELGRLAASGDAAASVELLRALAPSIRRWVRAVLGATHPDLDDAVQHALIGLMRAMPAYRGDSEPTAYARVIALRAAIAVRKRAHVLRARHEDDVDLERLEEPGEVANADDAAARERKNVLRELLDELPEAQAETLALRVVFGCSLEEVARQTGVPLNTVRSRVRLAKERLKARIESDPALRDLLGDGSIG